MKKRHSRNQGLLLVVMAGILSLLMVLAVFFSVLSRVERTRSVSDTDRVRAKLLARSGMEYALVRLLESAGSEEEPADAGVTATTPPFPWNEPPIHPTTPIPTPT